jgi:hypothetical protein
VTPRFGAVARSMFSELESGTDTDSGSAFWRVAPKISFASDTYGMALDGFETEVRSRWTPNYLYLHFTCAYDSLYLKPAPETGSETNGLWNWDVAEVFLGSDFEQVYLYKEFEVSPQGEWVDVDVDLSQPNHEQGWVWASGFQTAARVEESSNTWYAFMRIPFVAIDPRPAVAGRTFRANFSRVQGPKRTLIAWQPTMLPTFHVPAAFGLLVLE